VQPTQPPQRPPQRPVVGLPGQVAPALTTRQRGWTVSALQAFGLRSTVASERVLAGGIALAERVDMATFQPGGAAGLRQQGELKAGVAFNRYIDQLETFERLPPPRGAADAATLRTAAAGYLGGKKPAKAGTADARKIAICQATLAQLEVYDLKDQLERLGTRPKPLDSADAQLATAATVKLDLLSLPEGKRQAAPLDGGEQGVNATYWINKTGRDGGKAKSFICKPMPKPDTKGSPPGIPDGGEVPREALVGRAGELLKTWLSLDLDVPETHVVALDASFFPQDSVGRFNARDGGIPTSVQEVRPVDGPMARLSQEGRAKLPKAKTHALAIMDMITLNADRHGGNLLMAGGDPVPIDHGVSLCDPTTNGGDGLRRLTCAMATDHNVLLSLPSAHEPMDPAMIAQMKKLDPHAVTDTLKRERDALAKTTPAMAGKVTDAALEAPGRAAKFLRLAAHKAPQLSPAALQVALGKNAETLLDPALPDNTFNKVAGDILAKALHDQEVTRAVCLMNGAEVEAMSGDLKALGWKTKERYGAPQEGLGSDPVLAMQIAASGIRKDAPVDLKLGADPFGPTNADGATMEEIRANAGGLYTSLNQASKNWNPPAECKAHRALMALSLALVREPKLLAMVSDPVTPTKLLAEVRRLEEVRAMAGRMETQAGGALAAVRPKLLALKKQAAQALAAHLPAAARPAATAIIRLAETSSDPLTAMSEASADILKDLQDRLYAAADLPQAADYKKGIVEATAAGAIPTAMEYLADAGLQLQ
jgi:hypothetical protein